jgi:hypothetical protein
MSTFQHKKLDKKVSPKAMKPETLQKYNKAKALILQQKKVEYKILCNIIGGEKLTDLFLTSFENQTGILLYQGDKYICIYQNN